MRIALALLGLDDARWQRVSVRTFWTGASVAIAAAFLLALNRFGGLIVDDPRLFVRSGLIGVWGWLLLSGASWVALRIHRAISDSDAMPSLAAMTTAVGAAHQPLVILGVVLFVFAGFFQILGPGLVVAIFALVLWFPASLTRAMRHSTDLSHLRAIGIVAVPYALWLITAGRYVIGQIQHLL